jgi:hypothetical protein
MTGLRHGKMRAGKMRAVALSSFYRRANRTTAAVLQQI